MADEGNFDFLLHSCALYLCIISEMYVKCDLTILQAEEAKKKTKGTLIDK
jgi:hypothetical protein